MPNDFFQFKQFRIEQKDCSMKVTTEACLFGALVSLQGTEKRILDIGTGSGLLALMLAQRSQSNVDAVEQDQGAAMQAGQNFSVSPWSNQLSIFHSSVQEFSLSNDSKYDLIVCNPPFFANHLRNERVPGNEAIHSNKLPQSDLIQSLTSLADPATRLWLLYPDFEFRQFTNSMVLKGWNVERQINIYNRPGKPIFRTVGSFVKGPVSKIEKRFFIRDDENSYSQEFSELLSSYYL